MGDVLRAIRQIGDPTFRGVLLRGVGLSVALLAATTVVLVWGARWFVGPSVSLPWLGEVTWLDEAAGVAVLPLAMVASIFLMVPVASMFTGLFLDRIAQAVEDRHYPALGPPRVQGWTEALRETTGFLALVVAVNLCALVAYLALAPFALFIFWAVNGFLLGREYAQMVAARPNARRGRCRVPQGAPPAHLDHGRADGGPAVDPGREPARPRPGRRGLHPSLPPAVGARQTRPVSRRRSSMPKAPDRMAQTIGPQISSEIQVARHRRRLSPTLTGAEACVPSTRRPSSPWVRTPVCSRISMTIAQTIA